MSQQDEYIDGQFIEKRFPNNRKMVTIMDLMLFTHCPVLFLKYHGAIYGAPSASVQRFFQARAWEHAVKGKMIAELTGALAATEGDWVRAVNRLANGMFKSTYGEEAIPNRQKDVNKYIAARKTFQVLHNVVYESRRVLVEHFFNQEVISGITIRESIPTLFYNLNTKTPEAFFIGCAGPVFNAAASFTMARMNAALALSDQPTVDAYTVTMLWMNMMTGNVSLISETIQNKSIESGNFARKLVTMVDNYRLSTLDRNWMACGNCMYECRPNLAREAM